jgi:hypothetical protein
VWTYFRLSKHTAGCLNTLQAVWTHCRLSKHTPGCLNILQAVWTHCRLSEHAAGCLNKLQAVWPLCRLSEHTKGCLNTLISSLFSSQSTCFSYEIPCSLSYFYSLFLFISPLSASCYHLSSFFSYTSDSPSHVLFLLVSFFYAGISSYDFANIPVKVSSISRVRLWVRSKKKTRVTALSDVLARSVLNLISRYLTLKNRTSSLFAILNM